MAGMFNTHQENNTSKGVLVTLRKKTRSSSSDTRSPSLCYPDDITFPGKWHINIPGIVFFRLS